MQIDNCVNIMTDNNIDMIIDTNFDTNVDTCTKVINLFKEYKNNIIINPTKIFIILNKIIKSIGEYFKYLFESKGYNTTIQYRLKISDCIGSTANELYIILYYNEFHNLLPKCYIYYQIEQKNSIFLTNKKYLKKTIQIIKNAEQVWEYSSVPTQIYKKYCENKLIWVPMPFVNITVDSKYLNNFSNLKYDVFFYGHKNSRRKKILEELSKYFKIKIGWECYDKDKIKFIAKSKIILNLHYYKDAGLETCRINEILNYNKLILSEKSNLDQPNMKLYESLVIFTDEITDDLSNIDNLVNLIKYYLHKTNYEKFIKLSINNKIELEKNIKNIIF